jgi:hypothetical protein
MTNKRHVGDQLPSVREGVLVPFERSFVHGFKRVVAFSVAGATLALSGCATTPPQAMSHSVPDILEASVGEVTVLADRTLRKMGYEVVDNNLYAGFVHARRRVANDPFGRSTSLRVTVMPGQSGSNELRIQAESCPGCVHQGILDPDWMARNFIAELHREAAAGNWHAGQSAPAGTVPSAQPAVDQDWQRILEQQGFAQQRAPEPPGQKAVPEPARQKPAPEPPGQKAVPEPARQKPAPEPPRQEAAPVAARPEPRIAISDVRTLPETVKPGEPFSVEITFTAHDGAGAPGPMAVAFRYAIEAGGATLFERTEEGIKAPRGRPFQIVKHLTATKEQGSYTIRVKLSAGTLSAEGSSPLNVK